jgi:hypothetical protein
MPTKPAARKLALAGLGLALVLGGCGRLDGGAATAPSRLEAPATTRPSPSQGAASGPTIATPPASFEPDARSAPSSAPIAEPDLDAIERLLDDLGGAISNAQTDLTEEGSFR